MITRRIGRDFEHIGMDDLVAPLMERASIYVSSRAYGLTWHSFPVFELHYVHRGNLTWELRDGSRLHIHGGDVAVIQPNIAHHSFHDAEMPSVRLGFAVLPDAPAPAPPFTTPEDQADALRILRQAGTLATRGCPELGEEFCALHAQVQRLVSESSAPSPTDMGLLRSKLHALFFLMLRSLTDPVGTPHYAPVSAAIRCMEERLADNLTADDIALTAGVSKTRLYEMFHAEIGENPVAYHVRLRLEQSMDMLADGTATVVSIADRLGFSSCAAFSRSFRKRFGLSPTAWRRQALEETATAE